MFASSAYHPIFFSINEGNIVPLINSQCIFLGKNRFILLLFTQNCAFALFDRAPRGLVPVT